MEIIVATAKKRVHALGELSRLLRVSAHLLLGEEDWITTAQDAPYNFIIWGHIFSGVLVMKKGDSFLFVESKIIYNFMGSAGQCKVVK